MCTTFSKSEVSKCIIAQKWFMKFVTGNESVRN